MWKSRVERGELPLSVYSFSDFARETSFGKNQSGFEIKKYADKLKDIVCLLIGCTREHLEDREFKEKELGEEWWYWYGYNYKLVTNLHNGRVTKLFKTEEELLELQKLHKIGFERKQVKLTSRLLLQLLGTDCGRDIIHPDLWVLSLMQDYKGDAEIWKPIKNYEDSYEVSSYGNVRSLDRNIIYGENKGENHNRKGVILKPTLSGGYFTVSLKGKTHTVHSLVGEAFLNKLDNDFVLNHIDYNKQNNFYKNLEYISQGDNVRHNYAVGKANIGENQKDAKLDVDKVIAIRKLLEEGTLSQNRIAKLFEVSPTTITDIKKGRKWNHVGREVPIISPIIPKPLPNWIITDMRFPNELEAVKSRGGITIRVNRPCEECGVIEGHKMIPHKNTPSIHPSETSLDSAEFDYTIESNSTIEDLIHTVTLILKREKII